jgi:hypothetical protein
MSHGVRAFIADVDAAWAISEAELKQTFPVRTHTEDRRPC